VSRVRTLLLLLGCLACLTAVAGAVPDARLTVDALEVDDREPVAEERVGVNVTVANSAGSPAAVNVTDVRLLVDGEERTVARAPGALSPGDDLSLRLWTRFADPGEHRVTVVVDGELPPNDEGDRETVSVRQSTVVDVRPREAAVSVRARALSEEERRQQNEGSSPELGSDVTGILGGAGGDDSGSDADVEPMDSPVAVTVVNTGTVAAERVVIVPVVDDEEGPPFAAPAVAPGEEERVVVDLGPVADRANVTLEARYVADGAAGVAGTALDYPPRDGDVVVTGAAFDAAEDGTVTLSANLGNVGDRPVEGVVVRLGAADGVTPAAEGRDYFVGEVGASDFVPFELTAAVNATRADGIPIVVEYTDRGVRYTETVVIAYEPPAEDEGGGAAVGQGGVPGRVSAPDGVTAPALALAAGLTGLVAAGLLRRRDV